MRAPELKREYTTAWIAVGLGALALEVLGATGWPWLALLVAVAIGEDIAVMRGKGGDTLSEQLWAWRAGGWARDFTVAALSVWIAIRFYQLGPGGDVGRAVLSIGLGAWLIVHWVFRGRHG